LALNLSVSGRSTAQFASALRVIERAMPTPMLTDFEAYAIDVSSKAAIS
jgi:hypothetical protein